MSGLEGANAEAGSSRGAGSVIGRMSRNMAELTRIKSPTSPRFAQGKLAEEQALATSVSASTEPPTGPRKVRTVPPSAAYDPPSPTLDDISLPGASNRPDDSTAGSAAPGKRPRPVLRYSTSDSSSNGAISDSDSDPPWWTFTQNGMAKMKARSMRRTRDVQMGLGEAINMRAETKGKDKEKMKRRAFPRRQTSRGRSRNEVGRPTGLLEIRHSSVDVTDRKLPTSPLVKGELFQPTPIHMAPNFEDVIARRITGGESTAIATTGPIRMELARSTSAPTSPVQGPSSPGQLALDTEEPIRLSHETSVMKPLMAETPDPMSPQARHQPRRQLTAPSFPRFKRRNPNGSSAPYTDSEAAASHPPRARVKQRLHSSHLGVPFSEGTEDTDGNGSSTPRSNSAPTRPKQGRRQTTRMKLNIPPPISQHFAHGWPHAGTWQDALYGYYDDQETPQSRKGSKDAGGRPRRISRSGEPELGPNNASPLGEEQDSVRPALTSVSPSRRQRSRRSKRYRQALVPPTPAGLGFVPSGAPSWREGRVNESSFDWDNGTSPPNVADALAVNGVTTIEATKLGYSGGSSPGIEKDSAPSRKPWWILGGGRDARTADQDEKQLSKESDWAERKRRMRRSLFLDARVTMYIRSVNLAVIVALLALAITIRLDLYHLSVPGLIGSSTTLIIAYSSFTILHNLTAIYREYFGKPIGLWGLRSKMLWVCLDLLFVALWSSAMSVSTNDYIATPLECSSASPWWRHDLADDYARLLGALEIVSSANAESGNNPVGRAKATAAGITTAEKISHSLGIVLPDAVLQSGLTGEICRRQAGCIALSLFALLLYGGNMVLSLFRIFETISRTANVGRAVMI